MNDTRLGSNYWKLVSASASTNLGDGLLVIALPWLASAITRDPLHVALVALATRLPWLIFSLPAGVITDRVDRRRLIVWMDVARGVVMLALAALVVLHHGDLASPGELARGAVASPANQALLLGLLYLAALLVGTAEVMRDNAAQTLMPAIVAKDRLEKANGRLWGAEVVTSQFVGPPLAGLLLGVALVIPFVAAAGMFVLGAALVLALVGTFMPRPSLSPEAATGSGIAWRAEIGEGLRWLWRHHLLRALAVSLGAISAVSATAMAVYVLFAQEVLGLDATQFGLLSTGTGVGALLSSLLADRVSRILSPGTALFVSIIGMGLAAAVIGLASSGIVVWAAMGVTGFVIVMWNVITVSLRQRIIPDHMLGRVNSVYRFLGWGTLSFGTLLGGVLVQVGEAMLGREWALRMPFLIAATGYAAVLLYGLPRVSSARIARAQAEADGSG